MSYCAGTHFNVDAENDILYSSKCYKRVFLGKNQLLSIVWENDALQLGWPWHYTHHVIIFHSKLVKAVVVHTVDGFISFETTSEEQTQNTTNHESNSIDFCFLKVHQTLQPL